MTAASLPPTPRGACPAGEPPQQSRIASNRVNPGFREPSVELRKALWIWALSELMKIVDSCARIDASETPAGRSFDASESVRDTVSTSPSRARHDIPSMPDAQPYVAPHRALHSTNDACHNDKHFCFRSCMASRPAWGTTRDVPDDPRRRATSADQGFRHGPIASSQVLPQQDQANDAADAVEFERAGHRFV